MRIDVDVNFSEGLFRLKHRELGTGAICLVMIVTFLRVDVDDQINFYRHGTCQNKYGTGIQ